MYIPNNKFDENLGHEFWGEIDETFADFVRNV